MECRADAIVPIGRVIPWGGTYRAPVSQIRKFVVSEEVLALDALEFLCRAAVLASDCKRHPVNIFSIGDAAGIAESETSFLL